jgi:lipoprotein-anchoring transpeptidase ErfK/SrfK
MTVLLIALLAAASAACGDPVSFQVLLDRRGFSSGQIDGVIAANGRRALTAFQQANGLPVSAQPDCETWQALVANDPEPTLTSYRITSADAEGPFARTIPKDLEQQAKLPALAYRSLVERLGERFHASPNLLLRLNKGVRFADGARITVPAVTPFDERSDPSRPATGSSRDRSRRPQPGLAVEVSRDDSSLQVVGPDGNTIFFAPVTSGSEHDPLPVGRWRVTSIDWRPSFHYNPALFWDAHPTHSTATIKPGPNNPVGVVWIGLNVEHYGLHGTAEPAAVGHTESHGCVRLTNWDAARLSALISVGTPVVFK